MIVYAVLNPTWCDLLGVFSTEEKALAYAQSMPCTEEERQGPYRIQSLEMDVPWDGTERFLYSVYKGIVRKTEPRSTDSNPPEG